MSLVSIIKASSERVDVIENMPRPSGARLDYYMRTPYSILASATSELGELAEEVQIHQNHSYKKPGDDGIVGEAIDTICCLLDLIHKVNPYITEDERATIAERKCDKWASLVAKGRGLW